MEMVAFLLANGASVNQVDSEGWTPLHVAASCGYPDIVEYVAYVSTVNRAHQRKQLCITALFVTVGTSECGVGARLFLPSTIPTLL